MLNKQGNSFRDSLQFQPLSADTALKTLLVEAQHYENIAGGLQTEHVKEPENKNWEHTRVHLHPPARPIISYIIKRTKIMERERNKKTNIAMTKQNSKSGQIKTKNKKQEEHWNTDLIRLLRTNGISYPTYSTRRVLIRCIETQESNQVNEQYSERCSR